MTENTFVDDRINFDSIPEPTELTFKKEQKFDLECFEIQGKSIKNVNENYFDNDGFFKSNLQTIDQKNIKVFTLLLIDYSNYNFSPLRSLQRAKIYYIACDNFDNIPMKMKRVLGDLSFGEIKKRNINKIIGVFDNGNDEYKIVAFDVSNDGDLTPYKVGLVYYFGESYLLNVDYKGTPNELLNFVDIIVRLCCPISEELSNDHINKLMEMSKWNDRKISLFQKMGTWGYVNEITHPKLKKQFFIAQDIELGPTLSESIKKSNSKPQEKSTYTGSKFNNSILGILKNFKN